MLVHRYSSATTLERKIIHGWIEQYSQNWINKDRNYHLQFSYSKNRARKYDKQRYNTNKKNRLMASKEYYYKNRGKILKKEKQKYIQQKFQPKLPLLLHIGGDTNALWQRKEEEKR